MRDHTRKHFHEHHYHENGHHPEREHGPHGGGEHHGHGGPHGRGRFGGQRGRARRGEARFVLLDALRDGPKHGYEIIKALEERSGGQYAPSPGTVYPTMQYLEDMGLVRADQEAERRVFHLTDAGRADLEAHAPDITDFWARFTGTSASPSSLAEVGFLREDLEALSRTVWDGLNGPLAAGELDIVRQVRAALAHCRAEVRAMIADMPGKEPGKEEAQP